MRKLFVCVLSENNIENTVRTMNVLSKDYSKVTNPVIDVHSGNEFILSFCVESDRDMIEVAKVLNENELTKSLKYRISE